MVKRLFVLLLAVLMLLCAGCTPKEIPQETLSAETTAPTIPATVPEDGNPEDVTCKGSYSRGSWEPDAVVATVGDYALTNEQLQVWYWLEAAAYLGAENGPDFTQPLDTQACSIDDSVNSWQQYFLKRALNTWHSVCALELQARELPLPTEEAYRPNPGNYDTYMVDIPATDYLYGYNPLYQPNSMHDAYLAKLPETLGKLAREKGYQDLADMARKMANAEADVLTDVVRMYNYSYMYFTTLSYHIESAQEDVSSYMIAQNIAAGGDRLVDVRQILMQPGGEENPQVTIAPDGTVNAAEGAWEACLKDAEELLLQWQRKLRHTEEAFADLAYKNSKDAGSAVNGGIYRNISKGQLMPLLEEWCFDEARQVGDTTVLRSPYGVHILYFSGSREGAYAQAEAELKEKNMEDLVEAARKRYEVQVDYSAITLTDGEASVCAGDVLYPDIAHERFPEIPLYLQQDYPGTMYGGFELRTNGCGITSLAMLASYMADDELTPPEMCARYGRYSHANGTDGMIFIYEPSAMGFYLREKTYEPSVAKAALEEGQIVISLQHKGYWTRGGHYIVLEKITEEGLIQVRDSNLYNYGKIHAHKEDLHTWGSITSSGSAFWIFEDKVTRIPMCSRCGEGGSHFLKEEYICEKCDPALLRRNAYLSICADELN